jgi:hypothetical protein
MTVWVYVDTRKRVGDEDHLKLFAIQEATERGLPSMIRKA